MEKHFYHLASYSWFSYEVLRMYDVEKGSAVLANAADETRHVYILPHNKMAALGYVYTLGKQTSRSPERCTSRNATSAELLEVQIPPHVFIYKWDR